MRDKKPRPNFQWQQRLSSFMTSRWMGLLIALGGLFWRAGGEINGMFTSGAIGAAIVFAMLHTESGRRWLFLGWLTVIGIFVLNLVYIEFRWEVLKALVFVLAVGAFWFVDWQRLMRRLQDKHQSASLRFNR